MRISIVSAFRYDRDEMGKTARVSVAFYKSNDWREKPLLSVAEGTFRDLSKPLLDAVHAVGLAEDVQEDKDRDPYDTDTHDRICRSFRKQGLQTVFWDFNSSFWIEVFATNGRVASWD